ncbi:MAG: class IV adenylate cyclase [Candidatus Aenigmatarchaeota archaeon]
MVHEDKEIELKFPLSDKQFLEIKERLGKETRFVGASNQKDEYFNSPHRNFLEPEIPIEWLSIRERDGKSVLNYKYWHRDEHGDFTHCDEFETVLESADQARKMFKALDFKSLITVEKKRLIFRRDGIEIALDDVKDLGYFIEVEAKEGFSSIDQAKDALFNLCNELGVDLATRDIKGYPNLIMIKKDLL